MDPSSMIGKSLIAIVGTTAFIEIEPQVRGVLRGDRQFFERTMIKADGSEIYTLIHFIPKLGLSNRVIGFSTLVTDITELRKAQAAERLAASVYDSIAESIIVQDIDQTIISVNKAFTRTTGYEESEVVGKTTRILGVDRGDEDFRNRVIKDMSTHGFWQGEVWSRRKNGEVFVCSQTSTMIPGDPPKMVSVFSDATERWTENNRQRQLALHDALTNLPNRTLLNDRIQQAIAKAARLGERFATMFIDIDGFKEVNDRLGHAVGDHVLKAAAELLLKEVREGDTVGRLGGDEFIIVLGPIVNDADVRAIGARILAALQAQIVVGPHTANIGASIGIAFFPDHGRTPEQLLLAADQAMYAAKRAGKNSLRLFEESLG
jgi:diguanylate cyclase (GGDEF)-like protein/PAS domain S-box-containing protein